MEKEIILEMIKKQMGYLPKPIEYLAELDINMVKNHIQEKKNAYNTINALEPKFKSLIALSVGIALNSKECILKNTKEAKMNGASTEEILEVFSVAKFSKSALSLPNFTETMEWLLQNENK